MDIGKSLRLAIAERNIKHKELAEKSGVSSQTISHITKNKSNPSIDMLAKLSGALDYKVSELIALGE
jgi:transcriptional regulator with XRE-family HTH domain